MEAFDYINICNAHLTILLDTKNMPLGRQKDPDDYPYEEEEELSIYSPN